MRHRGGEPPFGIAQDQMHRVPAAVASGRAADLQRAQESMADEGVRHAGNSVPFGRRDVGDRGGKFKGKAVAIHSLGDGERGAGTQVAAGILPAANSGVWIRWSNLMICFGQSSGDFEDAVDFHKASQRQHAAANSKAGMFAGIAEGGDHQV